MVFLYSIHFLGYCYDTTMPFDADIHTSKFIPFNSCLMIKFQKTKTNCSKSGDIFVI